MKIRIAVLSIVFALLILIGSFQTTLYNRAWYEGRTDTQAMNSLLDYFQGKGELPSGFDARERTHLADVKEVFEIMNLVFILGLLASFLLLADRNNSVFRSSVCFGCGLVVITVSVFGVLFNSFDTFFRWMHPFFFSGDSWLFPADSYILHLFPLEFFFDFTLSFSLKAITFSVVILAFFCVQKLLPKQNTVIHKQ